MNKLKGRAPATLDAKNRVSLPAKYRKLLPEELVITKSPDSEYPALVAYTSNGFEEWIDRVLTSKGGYRANDRSHDSIIEEYYENAEDVKIDGVGRILIPVELREYAGIDKDVMFSGARDHLVIRSKTTWEAYQQRPNKGAVYDREPV